MKLSDDDYRIAHQIRQAVSPLRLPDGTIDPSAVAQELTLRDRAGLPHYIAELDGARLHQAARHTSAPWTTRLRTAALAAWRALIPRRRIR